jgi:hypothetical protein
MLGFYENFPEKVHKTARFATPISSKRLQQTLVQVFQAMNGKTCSLEDVADPSVHQCTVIFEFGIAEANNFNYIDTEETTKALEIINKKPLQIMDFFNAIRYYKTQKERKIPLKFDYYMIRFIFNKSSLETQVFHERGPRYMSPEDVVNLIVDKVNETFSKRILKAIETS